MSKKKVKPTKDNANNRASDSAPIENVNEITESDEVLEVVKTKPTKQDKIKAKESKKEIKASKKKAKNSKPRRNFIKEIFSELKKVNWPSFKKACKQTGAVLVIVAVFMVVVLGIDLFLAWLMKLIVG